MTSKNYLDVEKISRIFFKMASCTGVMLGVPDEKISFEDDTSNAWTTNKFGGVPNWVKKAPDVQPQCNMCGYLLPMVAQIYCPLESSAYHRVLYLFGCINVSCWNKNESWKVLRCQLPVQNKECEDDPNHSKQDFQNDDIWCDGAGDWEEIETSQETNIQVQHLEEQTKNLNLNESRNKEQSSEKNAADESIQDTNGYSQPTELSSRNMVHFFPYYINVLEESHLVSRAKELTRSEKKLLDEYTAREGSRDIQEMMDVTREGNWGGEKYEMSKTKHGDKIFHKFKKALSLCPNQCLRYGWNGEPLLMTSQGLGTIPACNSCGRKRVFELQLMPALVSLLKIDEQTHNDRDNSTAKTSEFIEFGTVFVYSCSQSCWSESASFLEEWVIVHSDPDQHLFK